MEHDTALCIPCIEGRGCEEQAWAQYFAFLKTQSLYQLLNVWKHSQGIESDFCEQEMAHRALTSTQADYFLNMAGPRYEIISHWASAPCPN